MQASILFWKHWHFWRLGEKIFRISDWNLTILAPALGTKHWTFLKTWKKKSSEFQTGTWLFLLPHLAKQHCANWIDYKRNKKKKSGIWWCIFKVWYLMVQSNGFLKPSLHAKSTLWKPKRRKTWKWRFHALTTCVKIAWKFLLRSSITNCEQT